MSKVIVYTTSDGNIVIVHPAYGDRLRPAGDTDEALIERCLRRLPLDVFNVHFIEKSDIPRDRTFRAAWTSDGTSIRIDMAKAREHWLDTVLRPERNAALAALDIEALKAIEAGDATALSRIAAEKQALRDMPVRVRKDLDAAVDPEQLKQIKMSSK